MEVVKFTLDGKFAFFKKPDVNAYGYFTYGNIHKVALMGIFGAILGFDGYNQQQSNVYPEFYEKLMKLNVSIIPKDISCSKKMQIYNNSVGYASKEKGGNLIVKEQWLENPIWDIMVIIQDDISKNLKSALINREFIYLPYLGKNDHLANITNISIINDIPVIENADTVDSLFLKKHFELENNNEYDLFHDPTNYFKYEEKLPIGLEELTNKYILESFIYTNMNVKNLGFQKVYRYENKNIVFI
ncbi:MAG: type I-B CRISPR-associated protein Cas5b [Clostridia bacterium]